MVGEIAILSAPRKEQSLFGLTLAPLLLTAETGTEIASLRPLSRMRASPWESKREKAFLHSTKATEKVKSDKSHFDGMGKLK